MTDSTQTQAAPVAEMKTIPAAGTAPVAKPVSEFAALRTWFRNDSAWVMRELDLIRKGDDVAKREELNPVEAAEEAKE